VVIETFVPWKMARRGVRKRILTPLGEPEEFAWDASADAVAEESPLLRVLELAHHWQRLLDEERAASVDGIAELEGLDISYVRRLLRLTLLAPDVIETALNERLFSVLSELLGWCPDLWASQHQHISKPQFRNSGGKQVRS
jgi:hypothetical protein